MENKKEMYESIVDKIIALTPEKKMELVKKYASKGEFSIGYKVVLQLLKDDSILENININKPTLSNSSINNAIKAYTQPHDNEPKRDYSKVEEPIVNTKNQIQQDNKRFSNMLEKALTKRNNEYLDKHNKHTISVNIYTPKI